MSKVDVLAPTGVSKLIFSRDQGVCHFSAPTFCTNLFIRGIVGNKNVLAPTVCFKFDSFTTSGSMTLFCSYSLYQSCLVEVI